MRMNKYKLFSIGVLAIPISYLLVCNSSCVNSINTYRKYIMNQSISLMWSAGEPGHPSGTNAEGTGWFFKKLNKYEWLIATNLHVEEQMELDMRNSIFNLYFAYETDYIHPSWKFTIDNDGGGRHDKTSFTLINKSQYSLNNFSHCIYEKKQLVGDGDHPHKYGVDFALIRVDFGETVKSDNYFKKRLDTLKDVKLYSKGENKLINDNFYIGGFPHTSFNESDHIYFTMFNFNITTAFTIQTHKYQNINEEFRHPATPYSDGKEFSMANMFVMNDFQGNSHGGSSGSIAINSKKEVCGILWGMINGPGPGGICECLGVDLLISNSESYFSVNGYNIINDYYKGLWIN